MFQAGGFWGGRGGLVITVLVMGLVVALLVGWVLLWLNRPEPSILLLTLGCVAFSLVLMTLALVQNRLTTYWRLRQAQAAYLAGVSHNLRTPISAIRSAAQVLQSVNSDDERRVQLLQAIVQESRLIGLRVDNVLETGRLDVERQAFFSSPVNFSATVRTAVEAVNAVVNNRDGKLRHRLEPDCWIDGDEKALRLVVDNLIDNAIKYAQATPDFHVELSRRDKHILLRVQDTGLGVEPSQLGSVFKRFWRGSVERSGTGLGLSLAQSIVRGHGGEIHLFSDGPNQGTLVEVWLHPAGEEE